MDRIAQNRWTFMRQENCATAQFATPLMILCQIKELFALVSIMLNKLPRANGLSFCGSYISFIISLIFSNDFILVRVAVDPDPIPGKVDIMKEYTNMEY